MLVCATCEGKIREDYDNIYDSWGENTFCSDYCFEEWLDDNFHYVASFYRMLNEE